jgi:hypothetical protein
VDYEELYGMPPHAGALAAALRPLPLIATLAQLSAWDALLKNAPYQDGALQIAFAQALAEFDPGIRDALISRLREGALWIHEAQLGVLSRYALTHCAGRAFPVDGPRCLFRALLACNQSYNTEIRVHAAGDRSQYIGAELKSILSDNESAYFTLCRYAAFFEWARTVQAREFRDDWLDLDEAFRASTGLDVDDFRAAIMALQGVFRGPISLDEGDLVNPSVDAEVALAGLPAGNPIKRVLELLSITVDEARAAFFKAPESSSMFGLMPFARRPVLRLSERAHVVPVHRYLLNAAGTGLFYRLSDYFSEADPSGRLFSRFHRFFGHFLEEHVRSILRRATSRMLSATDGDCVYRTADGELRSSDVYLLFGAALVIVEVTSSRFNVRKTLFEENEESLDRDLGNMVVGKFEQIRKRFDDWMAGRFEISGVERKDVKRVFAVVVTSQYIPHLLTLSERIEQRVAPLVDVFDGFEVVECEEVELLDRQFPDGNLNLYRLLAEKNRTEAGRLRSLTNYLHLFKPHLIYLRRDENILDHPLFRRASAVAARWFTSEGVGGGSAPGAT